jgi:branched-chain amino acid transport system substrate-binding protein
MDQAKPFSLLNADGSVSRRSFLVGSGLGIGGLLVGGLAACGKDEGGPAAAPLPTGPLAFGWIQPTTGLYAAGYAPIYVSGQIAVEEINKAGGILGRPIERSVQDDEGDPAKEPAIIQKLISENIGMVLGPTGGSQVQASIAAAARSKIVQCAWTNDSSILLGGKYPYEYGLTWNTQQSSQIAVDYLVGKRSVRKVAILAEDSAFGQSATQTTKESLAKIGISNVPTETYPVSSKTMDTYVRNVLANDIEGIFYWGANLQNTVQIFAALDQQNARLPIVGQAAMQYDQIVQNSPIDIIKDVWSVGLKAYTWTNNSSPTQRRVDYVKKLSGYQETKGGTAIHANAPYYDFPWLLKAVIEDIKSFDPEKIKAALDNVKGYDGMIGKITLTPNDHGGLALDDLALLNVASGRDTTKAVGGVFRQRES